MSGRGTARSTSGALAAHFCVGTPFVGSGIRCQFIQRGRRMITPRAQSKSPPVTSCCTWRPAIQSGMDVHRYSITPLLFGPDHHSVRSNVMISADPGAGFLRVSQSRSPLVPGAIEVQNTGPRIRTPIAANETSVSLASSADSSTLRSAMKSIDSFNCGLRRDWLLYRVGEVQPIEAIVLFLPAPILQLRIIRSRRPVLRWALRCRARCFNPR